MKNERNDIKFPPCGPIQKQKNKKGGGGDLKLENLFLYELQKTR